MYTDSKRSYFFNLFFCLRVLVCIDTGTKDFKIYSVKPEIHTHFNHLVYQAIHWFERQFHIWPSVKHILSIRFELVQSGLQFLTLELQLDGFLTHVGALVHSSL